jgi:hypothetical protein
MHDTRCSREPRRDVAYARTALIVGLTLVAIATSVTLTEHPIAVIGTSGTTITNVIGQLAGGNTVCQNGESLPANTSAIRLSLFAYIGPSIKLDVSSGETAITHGERGAGWTAQAVTIPVAPLPRAQPDATVCATAGTTSRSVAVLGQAGAGARPGEPRSRTPRMSIEYLRPSSASWWSSILSVARTVGLGRALSGTWTVLLLAALMLAAGVVGCWLLLTSAARRPRTSRVPTAAWACALVAFLNAACWSLLTPPFQAVDEPSHYAYVELLANSGHLPSSGEQGPLSPQETGVLDALHYYQVRLSPQTPTIRSRAEQAALASELAQPLSQAGASVGLASSEPPLYYALETIPYELSANVLDRLELMRLLSAVFAALTALFVVLFLREALPGIPWAWTVGGLGVALSPLLGYVSGAVTPEAMLAAVSAALFYCLARGLRRGLTRRLAIAIGAVIAVGLLTKLNFIGLLPGAVLGLVILTARAGWAPGARAWRLLVLALAIAGAPALAYLVVNLLSGHPTLGLLSSAVGRLRGSVWGQLSYVWQFYLPRLPGMHSDFPGILTTRDIWFDRVIGLYGWLDTAFPGWVYDLAILPAALIGGLCVRALVIGRSSVRTRAVELAVYGAMVVGALAQVGIDSYVHSFESSGELFAEPRYLLPMAALLGAVLALAARGAGRRWLPVVGALIVVAVLAHNLFSQLQVIARYYG